MNQLPIEKRAQALTMLVEGSSMRSVTRVLGISFNAVAKLVVDAGKACMEYHDEAVRDVKARHIQADEIWAFCYSKQRNAERAQGVIDAAGDVWTWTGIDSDTKLLVSWLVGGRDSDSAVDFMDDLRGRLANRVQLSTDGHSAYLEAVEGAFGGYVDYAQLVKLYGQPSESEQRRYSPAHCIGTQAQAYCWEPESGRAEHVTRRAPQLNDANVHATLHPVDQCFLQEAGESHILGRSVRRLVQFCEDAQEPRRTDSGPCCWTS